MFSDSLNARSEDKKLNSNSNDEEHRSSPSFYKIDTSENEMEGDVREDIVLRKSYIPISSFASGTQAQIAYTDQMEGQEKSHKRVTSNPPSKN